MFRLFTKIFMSIAIGLILFYFWTTYMDISYDSQGSLDIVSGAIIEFFLFTLLMEFFNNRQQKANRKEMQNHLKEIEKLIKRGNKYEY